MRWEHQLSLHRRSYHFPPVVNEWAQLDKGAYVMGAPEFIFDTVSGCEAADSTLAAQGYRVLLLAKVAALTSPKPTAPEAIG